MPQDLSNGYDAMAAEFIAARQSFGRDIIQDWAASLPQGGHVLDIGAGFGEPITPLLIEAGLRISALDASPAMVTAYKQRFPDIETACEPVETSSFFNRSYDGILAVGLIFLLPADTQERLIERVSNTLRPSGKFIFSAPTQTHIWTDMMTGQKSESLGQKRYNHSLTKAGLTVIRNDIDEGGSHYYTAQKAL